MEEPIRKTFLNSGELARLAGVSADTLRHYERMRVLPEPRRSPANYRMYPQNAVDRVKLVRRALAVGFTLPELAKILKVREQGGAPCKQVKALLEDKLAKLDHEIGELTSLRASVAGLLDDWRNRLASAAPGEAARLLETLPALSNSKGTPHENSNRTLRNGNRRAGAAAARYERPG